MANDKRFVVKNGLRAQNIDFRSPDELSDVFAEMLDNGTLTLSSSTEQLLSLNTDGTISISPSVGNVLIGTDIDNGVDKVQVDGTVNATNFIGDLTGSVFADDSTLLVDALTSTHYGTFIGSFFGEDGAAIEANVVGDLTGSVFADDSTLLVDAINSKIILDNNTTDDLSEGDTNQYYTKTRVQRDSRIISLIFGS